MQGDLAGAVSHIACMKNFITANKSAPCILLFLREKQAQKKIVK